MSATDLFVTGASGFVGTHLLQILDPVRFGRIALLSRSELELPDALRAHAGVELIRAPLGRPERYAGAIGPDTTIIHLAARTGHAEKSRFWIDNVEGTASLIEAAEAQGARHLIFVSTIAAGFQSPRSYPYAESKREAEAQVRRATVPWTIVRPTIVLGRGSPVWRGLATLARLPVPVAPAGGHVEIQPIDVDDLVEALLALVRDPLPDETIELGGPERLTLKEFLRRARSRMPGLALPPVPMPIRPGVALLRGLEQLVPAQFLPVGSGQFSSFLEDGTAAPHPFWEARRGEMRGLDRTLERLLG